MYNPHKVTEQFEKSMAEFTGSPYAVAVESCSAAIFLSLLYIGIRGKEVVVPKHTYPSIPAAIVHSGGVVKFKDIEWQNRGYYQLGKTGVIDSAKYIARDMYKNKKDNISLHNKIVNRRLPFFFQLFNFRN